MGSIIFLLIVGYFVSKVFRRRGNKIRKIIKSSPNPKALYSRSKKKNGKKESPLLHLISWAESAYATRYMKNNKGTASVEKAFGPGKFIGGPSDDSMSPRLHLSPWGGTVSPEDYL